MKLSNNAYLPDKVSGLTSVIVPVYKVERYLEECVDSILAQTYTNLEVILVDDGSPDNSGAICDRYAAEYPERVRVVHKPNGGLSSARNAGLDVARGEYIAFIDSDDKILPTMFAESVDALNSFGVDIVCSSFLAFGARHNVIPPVPEPLTLSGAGALEMALDWKIDRSSCTKVYRRSLIGDFRFPEGLINEDFPFVCRVLLAAQKVHILPKGFYLYRVTEGSISHTFKDSFFDIFTNLDTARSYIKDSDSALMRSFVRYELRTHIFSSVRIVQNRLNGRYKTWLRRNRKFVLRHWRTLLFDSKFPMRERMKAVYGFLHLPPRMSP